MTLAVLGRPKSNRSVYRMDSDRCLQVYFAFAGVQNLSNAFVSSVAMA